MKISIVKKEKGRIYKSDYIVRNLLGAELSHDEKGAPHIDGGFISITDTRNYWACAVSDNPVGLDMEEASRLVKPAVAKRFHPEEIAYLAGLDESSSEWKEEFLSIWVKKEAYMKLAGEGIRMGLNKFSVMDDNTAKCFRIKDLFVGIAGCQSCEYEFVKIDAPFEKSCLESAAAMLDIRMHSSGELRKKLADKGYPKDEIDEAIEKLREYSYVNDEEYAGIYAKKLAAQGKAGRRIEYELMKKGIDKSVAKEASAGLSESSFDAAMRVAGSMKCQTEKDLARIGRKLASLGYETSVIYDILSKLKANLKNNIED